jgi:5-methylcytosine-specific restriction endonuclease McrA
MRKNRGLKSSTLRKRPCILCGDRRYKKHVHHNIPRSEINSGFDRKDIFCESNEYTLCPSCHLGLIHTENNNVKIIKKLMSTNGEIVEVEKNNIKFYVKDGVWSEI